MVDSSQGSQIPEFKTENKSHVVIYVFEGYLVLFKDTIKIVTLHLTFKRF